MLHPATKVIAPLAFPVKTKVSFLSALSLVPICVRMVADKYHIGYIYQFSEQSDSDQVWQNIPGLGQ
jgi:hypothetical protein